MRILRRVLLLLCVGVPAAMAAERVGVRVGDHPEHGRVVFDWPNATDYTSEAAPDLVRLRFANDAEFDLGAIRRPPRNVVAIRPVPGGADIALRPGSRARVYRLGARVVVDVFAGAAKEPADRAAPAAQAASTATPTAVPAAAPAAAPIAAPDRVARLASERGAAERPQPARGDTLATPRSVVAAGAPPANGAAAIVRPAATAAPSGPNPSLAAPPVAARPAADGPNGPTPAPWQGPEAPAATAAAGSLARVPLPDAVPLRIRALSGQPRAVPLPFPPSTAAAVLRRGDNVIAAFDHALPLDLAPLRRDPVFAGLETQTVLGGTLFRLPMVAPALLRVRREGTGWLLEAAHGEPGRDEPARQPIAPLAGPSGVAELVLPADGPGAVLVLTDPLTGLPLLVGPVREAGQPVSGTRRLGEFDLLDTLLGVAVLARSEAVTLRAGPDRFLLASHVPVALEGGAETAQAAAMTRSFDFPNLPLGQLAERLRSQRAGIADTPPLARFPLRQGAVQTLLALGLPQEAQAMLALAATEDPRAATDPTAMALGGIAALLAGRLHEAAGLDTVSLPSSDEATLWRALLAATRGDDAAAAPGIAAALPLLLSYPETLRERVLPLAADTLAEAGAKAPLRRLLAGLPDAALPLPRGRLAEAEGRVDDAVAAYAQAADGRDRRVRARALRRSVELRLARGSLDAAAAAKALDATLFAWRDDSEELATRLRIAALRVAADGRGALALLRETEALFPEQAAKLFEPMQAAFVGALAQQPPLAAIALHDAYPELLPADTAGEVAVGRLAEAMASLDLPDRAAALLRGAAERATTAEARAKIGERWAGLLLENGDATGAELALNTTAGAALPTALREQRALLGARIQARLGNHDAAMATLRELGPAGIVPLSELLAERAEWPAAAAEHAMHLRAQLSRDGRKLGEAGARAAIRQAALLALAGDEAAVTALRNDLRERLPDGALALAFNALTAPQLRGLADLPRLQQELALFRALPGRLEALRASAMVTR